MNNRTATFLADKRQQALKTYSSHAIQARCSSMLSCGSASLTRRVSSGGAAQGTLDLLGALHI